MKKLIWMTRQSSKKSKSLRKNLTVDDLLKFDVKTINSMDCVEKAGLKLTHSIYFNFDPTFLVKSTTYKLLSIVVMGFVK